MPNKTKRPHGVEPKDFSKPHDGVAEIECGPCEFIHLALDRWERDILELVEFRAYQGKHRITDREMAAIREHVWRGVLRWWLFQHLSLDQGNPGRALEILADLLNGCNITTILSSPTDSNNVH